MSAADRDTAFIFDSSKVDDPIILPTGRYKVTIHKCEKITSKAKKEGDSDFHMLSLRLKVREGEKDGAVTHDVLFFLNEKGMEDMWKFLYSLGYERDQCTQLRIDDEWAKSRVGMELEMNCIVKKGKNRDTDQEEDQNKIVAWYRAGTIDTLPESKPASLALE